MIPFMQYFICTLSVFNPTLRIAGVDKDVKSLPGSVAKKLLIKSSFNEQYIWSVKAVKVSVVFEVSSSKTCLFQ